MNETTAKEAIPSQGIGNDDDQDGVNPLRGNDSNDDVNPLRGNDDNAELPLQGNSTANPSQGNVTQDVNPLQGNDILDNPLQGNVDPPQAPPLTQSAFQPETVDHGEALARFSLETSTRDEGAVLNNQSTASGRVSLPETTNTNVHDSRSNDSNRFGNDDETSRRATSRGVSSSHHENYLYIKYR